MSALLFHHARDLAYVRHAVVRQTPMSTLLSEPDCSGSCDRPDDDFHHAVWFDAAYAWVAERVGYWPIFLAVGTNDEDQRMTGYQDQWAARRGTMGERRRPESKVMLSWRQAPPAAVFMDFVAWHMVLNAVEFPAEHPHHPHVVPPSPSEERQVWKRSWRASDWMRAARRGATAVQAVVPELDLRTADELWCRNERDLEHLVDAGFDPQKVATRRLTLAR